MFFFPFFSYKLERIRKDSCLWPAFIHLRLFAETLTFFLSSDKGDILNLSALSPIVPHAPPYITHAPWCDSIPVSVSSCSSPFSSIIFAQFSFFLLFFNPTIRLCCLSFVFVVFSIRSWNPKIWRKLKKIYIWEG